MLIIGLTGGIASGKSAVAKALAQRGAVVLDADEVGHSVLQEPAVREALITRLGPEILLSDGRVSRRAVADRVFGESQEAVAERRFLERTLHPLILQRIQSRIEELGPEGAPAVVVDAPLLIESGWADMCQVMAFVDAPEEARRRRAATRGWTAEELSRREAAQMPIQEKRRLCDFVISNAGSLEDLEVEVAKFWKAAILSKASSDSNRSPSKGSN
jgi:dephospho-CoA kinase